MKKILALVLACSALVVMHSQDKDNSKGKFDEFRERINKDFNDTKKRNDSTFRAFRDKINAQYAEFLKEIWVEAAPQPAIPEPKEDKPVPPRPYIAPTPDTVPVAPAPAPKPEPVEPAPTPQPVIPVPVPEPVTPTPVEPAPVPDTISVEPIPTVPAPKPEPIEPIPAPDTVPVEPTPVAPVPVPDTIPVPVPEPVVDTVPVPAPEPVAPSPKPEPIPEALPAPAPRLIPFDVVITAPKPEIQPLPITPIYEVPQDDTEWFEFTFYGTTCKVRLDSRHKFTLASTSNDAIAAQWAQFSSELYDNIIRDCLALRINLNLCDYGYLQMLDALASAFMGEDSNEATFLMAYLYCQSGYQMRFAVTTSGKLRMLYASKHTIFNTPYYTLNDERFYPYKMGDESCRISQAKFEKEQALSFMLDKSPNFENTVDDGRIIQSARYPDMQVKVAINKNLIDFYNSYPSSEYPGNFMTQWAIYANTPLTEDVKEDLYPALKSHLEGVSQFDAVSRLLNFVQTGLEYEYDDVVWGRERAFFAEESLHYPYCDCEDRSILLSRLVRDLVGLDVVLVYYPGHLAAAVRFTDDIRGDHVVFEGNKYVVCDPTYIGAPIGMTMPGMDNSSAKLIKLER